ncbi:efflux RND transporter periplasmic adaptor subunit [Desulfosporosinus sp. SYSU MS00001]|uniref:efflux RND transporter periplasmic adaptor subunit n=1 Tax=Desulfosporosinus sp. SYSU MS00001 TaxID=3416284 RepID=UPI003CEC8E13
MPLDQQTKGPNEADIRSAQADIQIAQAQLASAQADLENASIVAPVDAVVISCPLQLGQDSDSNSIITLTPTGEKLEVDASIDQADITLDSYPNQHISGTVNSVALEGSTTQNVTTYELKAAVDNNSDLLRAGMNTNVDIIAAQATNVLTVPSQALKTQGNQTGVMVPGGLNVDSGQSGSGTSNGKGGTSLGNSRFIPVVIGLDDGTNAEIKSGLKEGQEVVTGTNSASTTTKSSSGSDLLFGGGGPGDGGPPPN